MANEYRQLSFIDCCVVGILKLKITEKCLQSWIEAMYPKEKIHVKSI